MVSTALSESGRTPGSTARYKDFRKEVPIEHAAIEGTVAQSQETVDRDYEGSWFYALR